MQFCFCQQEDRMMFQWLSILKVKNEFKRNDIPDQLLLSQVISMLTPFSPTIQTLKFGIPVQNHFMTSYG